MSKAWSSSAHFGLSIFSITKLSRSPYSRRSAPASGAISLHTSEELHTPHPLPQTSEEFHDQERFKEIAAGITETCYQMYHMNPSHLAPENVNFQSGKMTNGVRNNIQRPEAIEAIFYMWRLTKDKKYREWGWESEFGRRRWALRRVAGADARAPHSSLQFSSFSGVPGAREGAVGVHGSAGRRRPDR